MFDGTGVDAAIVKFTATVLLFKKTSKKHSGVCLMDKIISWFSIILQSTSKPSLGLYSPCKFFKSTTLPVACRAPWNVGCTCHSG